MLSSVEVDLNMKKADTLLVDSKVIWLFGGENTLTQLKPVNANDPAFKPRMR